jgi:hypothetical protein
MTNRSLVDSLSLRLAKLRKKSDAMPALRRVGGRGAATLALGAVLSVGGVAEVVETVHFTVQKDLDAVRVVKQDGGHSRVVARLQDGFAANSVYKLSRILPESFVSHRLTMFDEAWLPEERGDDSITESVQHHSRFRKEMLKINTAIRRDFFANAVPFGDLIHEKAEKYQVDPSLVAAVVETESRFRSGARSSVGARGLMQLMPRTGRWMGAGNLYDPEQNVDAGVKYIKYLSERFDGDLKKTIAAYNAGEGNVRRYNGVPPFRETQNYVKRVMHRYEANGEKLRAYNNSRTSGGGTAIPEGELTVR